MDDVNQPLIIAGVDVSHSRLVDLTKLADQALPFYEWIEERFQEVLKSKASFDEILCTAEVDQIRTAMGVCYTSPVNSNLPMLFDGIGRSYSHQKACYYFFSWIIRDAPQQRLGPLIQRITKTSDKRRTEVEIEALTALIIKYRHNVKTFAWSAIREVIIDRLEGSRRSIKGQAKESVVRTALIAAIQNFYQSHNNYGMFSGIQIPDKQVTIGTETFDVTANLLDHRRQPVRRILMPVKTRETEGGGHSHLFTRDILSAINAARYDNPNDIVVPVIVARNWSKREADMIRSKVDHATIFNLSPNDFNAFSSEEQRKLDDFMASVLDGSYRHSAEQPGE